MAYFNLENIKNEPHCSVQEITPDGCTSIDRGSKYYCMPCDYRLTRDKNAAIRNCRVIIEGLTRTEVFSSKFLACIDTAPFFSVIQDVGKENCIVYLRCKYSDDAKSKKEYLELVFPTCTVLVGNKIHSSRTKGKNNPFLEITSEKDDSDCDNTDDANDESYKQTKVWRKQHCGIVLNNIPNNMVDTHLAAIFPECHICWITRNTSAEALPLPYSYGFVAFESDIKAEEVLQAIDNHKICFEDTEILCVNYATIRKGVVNPTYCFETPECLSSESISRKNRTKFTGLSDTCRRILIQHLDTLMDVLQQLIVLNSTTIPQRKKNIQRRKDIARMIHYTLCLLSDDEQRRLAMGGCMPETEEEILILTEAFTRPGLLLGKEVFERYLIRTSPPPPNPNKHKSSETPSVLSPASKRTREVGLGVALAAYRGGSPRSRGRGGRGWQGHDHRGRGQSNRYGPSFYPDEDISDTRRVIENNISEMSHRLQNQSMDQDYNQQAYY